MFYLIVLVVVYVSAILARQHDRRARREFAARLGALYRQRSEFWRLRVWAQQAKDARESDKAARFGEQAAQALPGITRDSTALRRDYPEYAAELGWTPGFLDDELRQMGEAVTAFSLDGYDQWTTGSGRTPVESILNPVPQIGDDKLASRVHMVVGALVGAAAGLLIYIRSSADPAGSGTSSLVFYVVIGAVLVGHVASVARDGLWFMLLRVARRGRWIPGI